MGGSIDPLLGIVAMKKASGVVLSSGQIPALLMGGARSPLTMPPLSPEMMEDLLAELLSSEERTLLVGTGTVESTYLSSGQGSFQLRARQGDGKVTVTLSKGGARPTPASPPSQPRGSVSTPLVAETLAPRAERRREPDTTPPRPLMTAGDDPARLDPRLQALLDLAVARGASDLLLSSGARPLERIDGELVESYGLAPADEEIRGFFRPLLSDERWRRFESTGNVDFAFTHHRRETGDLVRVRANLFRHVGGVGAALRPLRCAIPTLADLQLPDMLAELAEIRHGLVLVTGATGSGKSTTIAALLEHLNRTRSCHIVTLEDPIEYLHRPRRALIHQREVGLHVDSFATGLRAALRENPDVLLVGEMRDAETIRLTLTAAQTGHLVLSTLHSANVIMAIERVIDVFRDSEKLHVRQELAVSLRHVIAQQLLPGAQGGRVPALEMLTVNHAVAAQIRDGRTHMLATQMEIGGAEGMISLERTLADLVVDGKVTRAAAVAAAADRAALQRLLDERARKPR